MKGDTGEARQALRTILLQGRACAAHLESKSIVRTDDDQLVTVTANGLGEIISLSIDERSLAQPQRLGHCLTSAVVRARKVAAIYGEKVRELRYPDIPELRGIEAVVFDVSSPVDYDKIDYPDYSSTKNAIAECGEILYSLAVANKNFRRQLVRTRIGTRAGYVQVNAEDTFLKIVLRPDAPRSMTLSRLADDTIGAIRDARARARSIRLRVFDAYKDRLMAWGG